MFYVFDPTTYDYINGPEPFMFDIIGLAGPLVYSDQTFRDIPIALAI